MDQSANEQGIFRSPLECIEHLQRAISARDLEAMSDCFEPDYQSEFPAHLDRAFGGIVQMRKNWSQIFKSVPDIQASLVRSSTDGATLWAEWEWTGTQQDSTPFLQRGITIQGVPEGRIRWVRLYMEPVERGSGSPNIGLRLNNTEPVAT